MRLLLFLLLPALGFAQTGFRAEFNYLVPDTPVEGGDYRLRGLYADGDALGFPVDSVTAGKFFYDAKGRLYEIVYSNAAQPLTIEVDTVGHSFAPTLGIGLLTDRTVNIFLPFETSKIAGKLRSIVEVETRKLIDFNSGVEVDKLADLLDVDTTGLGNSYIVRYVADSAKWYVFENNIDGLTDGRNYTGWLSIGNKYTIGNTGADNVFFTKNSNDTLVNTTGGSNTAIGYNAMRLGVSGGQNTGTGRSALVNLLSGSNNTASGALAGWGNKTGSNNTYGGYYVNALDSIGSNNTMFGDRVNTFGFDVTFDLGRVNADSVAIFGANSRTKDTISTNEIVIGAFAIGNGSNTATLGNNGITATYLKGTTNLRGYGAGNKEATDLTKTRSAYIAAFATDGTLLEVNESEFGGGSGGASDLGALTDVDTTGKTDGSIILYDETAGEWQAQANSIDNLTDGYYQSGNLALPYTGQTIIDFNQTILGNTTLQQLVSGGSNTVVGAEGMRYSTYGQQNTVVGRQAGRKLNGNDNVLIGKEAGFISNGTPTQKTLDFYNGVFIGQAAWAKDTVSTNEIVIGSQATGNGSNTATLGNNNITDTYLKGTTNLRGYGLGNKEAGDLSKTATDYVLRPASDGTILEQVNDIDGLTDGYKDANQNLYLGAEPITINPGSSLARFNVSTGNRALEAINNGYDNTASGVSAGVFLANGYRNVISGRGAFGGYIQNNYGLTNNYGNENVIEGAFAGARDSVSNGVVYIGAFANANENFQALGPKINYNSIFIGRLASSNRKTSIEEIAIGAYVEGKGDSTVVIGRPLIKNTYLNGTMNFNGYGLGNKEAADLSKTGSGYFLEVATDGTLIESQVTGDVQLTDLSVLVNSAGLANLEYDNTTGVFTYTPPDLSSYLTSEVDGSTTNELQTLSFNDATRQLTLSDDGTIDLTEGIQDEMAATLVQGEGITITYDDGAGTITVAAPSGAGNTDEQTLSINSATAELSISNGNTVDLSEAIDAQVNTLFVDGTNIQSTYDDGANTLTVRTTDALTQIDAITFDNNVTDAVTGRLQYDQDKGTLKFGLANNTPIYLGTDMGWYVKNQSGSSIAKGVPVYTSGTDGASGRKLISPMIADGSINAKLFLGITAETIANGGDGLVLDHGGIKGVNLSGFSANDVLYVSPTVAGTLVNTEPTAPNLKLPIGYVVNNASNGSLSIRSTVGTYLSENHDVQIASATNGDVLKFDGSKWVDGTDLVDDADADATNEIQTLTISNGLTPTQTGNDYDIEWGGNLTKATTVDGLDNYNILFDNLTSFTTNTVNDVRLNAVSTTYGNNSSLIFDDFTGASITNTGTTNQYTSSLNMLRTGELSLKQDRTYASEQLSQGLTIAAADATLKLFSNSVTNSTSTSINLSPDEVKLITPNVFATTAATGQFLQLTDGATGTVEFATALTAEVDGSVTNEIQDLSLSGNTLSLSGDATTVDLSGYLDEATTASNGLTETGNDIKLGGTLSGTTLIDIESNNFYINDDGATQTGIAIIPGSEEVNIVGKITGNTELQMTAYGLGNKEASDLSLTGSAYLASFATDGTLIEYPISSISGESTTASNGLTLSGSDVKLGGTLSEITNISMAGFNASIYDVSSNTGFAIQPSSNLIVNYGTQAFDDYGSGNKEASDLSKTKSNYKAAFATDGTLIEVDDIDAMVVACSDETTDITTGTAKVTFRAPHAMTITGVRASLTTASSSGNPTVDINEGGTSILGTKLTIDANEKTSTTAATAATITDTAIADDAEITIDVDAAGTGATGLKVTILYRKN